MSIQSVLLPLFVQVLLTFVLLFWAGTQRVRAVQNGVVRRHDVALREPNWPPHIRQVGYAYESQLELPLLFYALTILAWITRQADLLFVALAWVFVALRLVHAIIHVTTNNLGQRASAFILGGMVLALMWVIFMLRILLAL
jgi:hypothetical protein